MVPCFTQGSSSVSQSHELALKCRWFALLSPSMGTDSTSSACWYLEIAVVAMMYRKRRIVSDVDSVELLD